MATDRKKVLKRLEAIEHRKCWDINNMPQRQLQDYMWMRRTIKKLINEDDGEYVSREPGPMKKKRKRKRGPWDWLVKRINRPIDGVKKHQMKCPACSEINYFVSTSVPKGCHNCGATIQYRSKKEGKK